MNEFLADFGELVVLVVFAAPIIYGAGAMCLTLLQV
jgi:hypothetical protein